MTNLEELQTLCWNIAEEKGFHKAHEVDGKSWVQAVIKLALINTEVGEAIQELRKGQGFTEDFESELADILIRLLDLAEECGTDLESITLSKTPPL